MKRFLAMTLTFVLALALTVPALATEPVTPTPPEWIDAEEYMTFPGDEVYQPENWAKIEALREDARNGGLLVEDGSEDWADGSVGMRYETGLVRLKYALNAEAGSESMRKAFWSAGRAFTSASSRWGDKRDEAYYRLELEKYRALAVYDASYVSEWKRHLVETLGALNMTLDDFFSGQYMYLVTPEDKAAITADMERVELLLDGGKLELDVPPEAKNGRTMIPIRALAEALGAKVEWKQDAQEVVMERAGVTVTMTIGSTTATVDGKTVEMDVAPYATNGRTLIPARYVGEFFGQKVDWDGAMRQVLVTEDKSVAGDSNLEAWALPMGSMLAYINAGDPARFGVYKRTAQMAERERNQLSRGWGIESREALASTVLSMTCYGHNATFLEMAADVKTRSPEERAEITAASGVWPDYMWTFTERLDEKWGDRGILAWDLFRMSNLVQWGYTAGYVTYEEALTLLEPAATRLAENFTSWREAYENYLDGYNWWARKDDVLEKETMDTERGKHYYAMTHRRATSVIFDDTLFETGVIPLPEE